MKRIYAVLLLVLLIGTLAYAQKTGAPVTVINTPANPVPVKADAALPVQGSVAITGTVPVSGSVSVTNAPDVNVVNDGAHPLPITLRRMHWQKLLMWSSDGALSPTAFEVPPGKRIVVEYANVRAILGQWIDPTGNYLPEVILNVNFSLDLLLGPMGNTVQTNNRFFAASLPIKVVFEPGDLVSISNNSSVPSSCWVFLSGYLEDVQPN